ncbi:hypothetical protein AB3S75_022925 [Citrus x aurantiifolia]
MKNPHVLKDHGQVPALLKWAESRGYCYEEYNSKTTRNKDNICLIQLSSDHFCLCNRETSVGPHRHGYCLGDLLCNTTSRDNCSSECPKGYFSNPSVGYCDQNLSMHKNSLKFIIIGCSSGLGMLFLLIRTRWLYKFVKRRRETKLKQSSLKEMVVYCCNNRPHQMKVILRKQNCLLQWN